ncbi:MAG TPA: hypothetical protein PLQ22_01965 [Bacilli bacterium]|nr:hypothetical protein [Bacilli bacterium]
MDLKPLCQRVADRLGIDPLEIKFEEMIDDSRLYIKEEYVAINKKFENDYVECAKAITHEYRHVFQIFYANMFNDDRARRWRVELSNLVNTSNINNKGSNYIGQELELDAFSFTKYYLDKYESMKVENKINGYDEIIEKYISINYNFL